MQSRLPSAPPAQNTWIRSAPTGGHRAAGVTSSWRQSARGVRTSRNPGHAAGRGRGASFDLSLPGKLGLAGVVRDRQVPVKVTAVVDRDAGDLTRGTDETGGAEIQRRVGGDECVEVDQILALPQKCPVLGETGIYRHADYLAAVVNASLDRKSTRLNSSHLVI